MRHFIRGVPTRLSEDTLRDWVRAYETQGPAGLIPAGRADKGKARVLFT
jgi:Helix-turn-helix domain